MDVTETFVSVAPDAVEVVEKFAVGRGDVISICPEHGEHYHPTMAVTFTLNGTPKSFLMEPDDWKQFQHLVSITDAD